MPRARGSDATLRCGFESSYGTKQTSLIQFPFVESDFGGEQGLVASDLLGQGRDPLQASQDVISVSGNITVPADLRNLGHWLKLAMGAPTTTAIKATGVITFSANPAVNSTISLGGVTWTFVASGATGPQTNIGVNLAATLAQLETDLNASADTTIDNATYDSTATTLTIEFDTAGPSGNAFALATSTSPASNATRSGATLTGGCYRHVFASGGTSDLPSMTVEVGHPRVPSYEVDVGVKLNTMAFDFTPSGLSKVVLGLIGQGFENATATLDASPTVMDLTRFSQFQGSLKKDGVLLANITRGTGTYSNGLDVVRVIRDDGKIEGADEAITAWTGQIVGRFADTTLLDAATDAEALALEFGYRISAHAYLTLASPKVRLPRPKLRIAGPAGIESTYDFQGAQDIGVSPLLTITLGNDVASYA